MAGISKTLGSPKRRVALHLNTPPMRVGDYAAKPVATETKRGKK